MSQLYNKILPYFLCWKDMRIPQQVKSCAYMGTQLIPFALIYKQKSPFHSKWKNLTTPWLLSEDRCLFKFLDFKNYLKVGLSAVGKHYIVSALLRNTFTCMYGNITSKYVGVNPPLVEDYFS